MSPPVRGWVASLAVPGLRRKRRRARRRVPPPNRKQIPEEATEFVREILGVPKGSFWIYRWGDLIGPDEKRIPSWCDGVGGLHADKGIWQMRETGEDGKVLWQRLIYPKVQATPLEMLAEIAHEGGEE